MSTSRETSKSGDLFARWLRANARTPRNGNTIAVDSAPEDAASLANHFVALQLRDLRMGWVACVLDAISRGATLGEVARALVVVARRLHGVSISVGAGVINAELEDAPAPTIPARERKPHGRTLSVAQVRAARGLRQQGFNLKEIADRMGLPYATVWCVCTGKTYSEVK